MKAPLPIHPDDRIVCAPYRGRFSARACAEHHARARDDLHRQVRDFFRYCVLDMLHQAMTPERIDGSDAGA